jgi:hypothetical protein
MTAGFMIEAEGGATGTPDGHGRSLDCSVAQGVSGRLQRAVGVNIASCNVRAKVSESVKTSLYMYFEAGKPVVNSDFDEGGSAKL